MSLEGTINSYHPDDPTTGFVQIDGDVCSLESFELRKGVSLPVGTPVDIVALVYILGDGSLSASCVYGIRTKAGKVCYDLTKDHPEVIPYMVSEETAIFPNAHQLLYKKQLSEQPGT